MTIGERHAHPELERRLDRLDQRFDRVERRLDRTETRLDRSSNCWARSSPRGDRSAIEIGLLVEHSNRTRDMLHQIAERLERIEGRILPHGNQLMGPCLLWWVNSLLRLYWRIVATAVITCAVGTSLVLRFAMGSVLLNRRFGWLSA
jgi:hypothetical protein